LRVNSLADFTPPEITLPSNNDSFIQGTGDYDELTGVIAIDNIDGNIPLTMANVDIDINESTPVKYDYLGSEAYYTLNYTVKDAAGNTAIVQRYVMVKRNNPPAITMKRTDSNYYYLNVRKGSSSISLRDEIKSVADDVDGSLNNRDVEIMMYDENLGEYIPTNDIFTPDTLGYYQFRYTIKDAQGNVGQAQGNINVYDIQYNTTITNNTLPTLNGITDNLYLDSAYIVSTGTAFDPANPGEVKPRFLVNNSTENNLNTRWQVEADSQKARTVYLEQSEISWVRDLLFYSGLANYYSEFGKPSYDTATVQEVLNTCQFETMRTDWGFADETACRTGLQAWHDSFLADQVSYFDTDLVTVYDFTPLPDGAYDIYVGSWNIKLSFPSGLIIDTVKPEVSVTVPANPKAGEFSPALTGTVDDPHAIVIVSINGKSYTAKNNGNGTWILGAGTIDPLAPGDYDVTITVTDEAGNETTTTTKLHVLAAQSGAPSTGNLSNTGMSMPLVAGAAGVTAMTGLLLVLRRRK
jgi:hypothetical protein